MQRPTKHTYARCPGCFCVSRAYLISVSCAHYNTSPCASVCAAGGTVLLLWLLRWPKSIVRPATFVITLFLKAWVGGGRMKEGREWEKEEAEGKRKSRRTDDGKMAAPVVPYARCFERATLCRPLQMLNWSTPPTSSSVVSYISSSPLLNVSPHL